MNSKEIDNRALDKLIEKLAVRMTIKLMPILVCIYLLGIIMGYVIWGIR